MKIKKLVCPHCQGLKIVKMIKGKTGIKYICVKVVRNPIKKITYTQDRVQQLNP